MSNKINDKQKYKASQEKVAWQDIFTGAQMLFVAFGALVLVPLLTGLNPNVALFTAGIGTLLFQLTTKGKVPVFLASSFAFIAPISFGVAQWGIPATLGGLVAAGFVFMFFALLVKLNGKHVIDRILPPVVTGPIIMVIGLSLAPVAVGMAMGKDSGLQVKDYQLIMISMASLLTTLIVAIWAKGFFKLVPIIAGIVVGYVMSWIMGIVNFQPVIDAPWFKIPDFTFPEFHWQAILYMIPIVIAPTIEHVGDIMAISSVTGKDYTREPGLQRTLLGDGLATSTAGFFGGPPCITYAEVIGAVTLTRNFKTRVMTWAAIWAILMSFIGKIGAFLSTIPTVVMGGIMVLLFGSIASVGINILIKHKVDLSVSRNMCIVSLVLVFGIGGMIFDFGSYALQGISLCGILAILLNLILPYPSKTVKTD
ncbi:MULTISPECIES: uracil-xanthine permease family protein [unclassified Gilliamella]|uniref:uracil-xanthine permease family protein n=1 Tax=unclassified Gilliamella TaxID=2685620 RepID=UPI001C6A32F0|nr:MULTISPECIES: uracil-xanthine permease family protein [unclassified Gilliamella]MCX8574331.1 uracil-xanthine permease [Gilliamella sp. B3831]MCX8576562.1 uracil-xanthine permease [Gilliamella sp. B3815]MCX8590868.1 uracil-xanthine permease [Gilliamella sp. B3812]MCX8603551.1 uracil-xanthine permease [Gilliamella sp. B3823]MCX8605943.1 uracil-xanthine permease [Gilliamella sp. B3825]